MSSRARNREMGGLFARSSIASLVLVLALGPRGASAQSLLSAPGDPHSRASSVENRLDPSLSTLLAAHQAGEGPRARSAEDVGPDGWMNVAIHGTAARSALAAAGARVGTSVGSLTTALVRVEDLPKLLAVPGVEAIEASHPLEKYLNVSGPDIQVADMWAGSPPNYSGFTGRGIVIGIVDTGIDVTHPDFRTSTNHTRIKYLWDQLTLGIPPTGFNYGTQFTSALLDANPLASTDMDGHGTHLAGIAAGNGRATGNNCSAYRYVGVAPEADLIVVRAVLTDLSIIDGVNYVFQRAAILGEPAVVLVAAGNQRGAHDGSSTLDQALSAFTGPGRLLVSPVGNDGLKAIHARLDVPAGGSGALTYTLPTYSPSDGEYLDMQAWHEPGAQFQVRLTTPSGLQTAWIQPGQQTGTIPSADGAYSVSNDVTISPKGGKEIDVYSWYQGGTTPHPKSGTWKLDVQRLSGASSGLLHGWIASWRLGSGGVSPSFSANVDYTTQVASPAEADSAIGVSAYTTRNTWTNFMNQTSFYVDSPAIQDFADFSNAGPRRDGVQRPDIAAPGEGVVSALSTPVAGSAGNLKVDDGCHWIERGTSMASAQVAGALALLLQQTPTLTPSAARLMIRGRVRSDSHTGSVPNGKWGYGKLDLATTPTSVAGLAPGGRFAMAAAYPNPTRASASFAFTLSSADVASGGPVTLRILDVRGRELARVNGSVEPGDQRLTWNGFDRHGYAVPAGVYLGRLEVGMNYVERKLVKLP